MEPVVLVVADEVGDGWEGCCCLFTGATVDGVEHGIFPLALGTREQGCSV